MAPVTPDARLPGAVDAHRIAPHLDKIDGAGPEACEPTGCLVTHIIHHLLIGGERQEDDVIEDNLIPTMHTFSQCCFFFSLQNSRTDLMNTF